MPDCSICYGQCDREIHDATLAVKKWFRGQVIPAPYVAPPKKKGVPANPQRPTVRPQQRSVTQK